MEKNSFTDVVILAGGIGERLWPASLPSFPKQFISIADDISFLQASILRALAINPAGKIVIITRKDLVLPLSSQCASLIKKLPVDQKEKLQKDLYILAEPCARHTCAPLLLSCYMLELMDSSIEHTILVLASDHIIEPVENFVNDCKKASDAAKKENFVCFAINSTEAATGYGYIKEGESLSSDKSVFKIAQFKEKPNAETAKQYLDSGKYYWNSGMFGFTSDFFKAEVAKCEPSIYEAFSSFSNAKNEIQVQTENGIKCICSWKQMEDVYKIVPAIAVDNAVAEKTLHAVAIKTTFNWDDVGSWDAFEKHCKQNSNKVVQVQSNNNFVYSDIPVALCGIEDVIVVIKNGNALVMKKGCSDSMREVVKKFKEN